MNELIRRRALMMRQADAYPPDNEIWYTSYDGNIVTTSGVYAGIVTNTYSGGKGTIKGTEPITFLAGDAFIGKSQLHTITFPRSLARIGSWCFEGSGVERLDLTYVNYLDPYGSVYSMPRCTEVIIGPDITALPMFFLSYSGSIASVDIPANVLTIGRNSWNRANLLLTVIMRGVTPPVLADDSLFSTNADRLLYVPDAAYETYCNAPVYQDYAGRIRRLSEMAE